MNRNRRGYPQTFPERHTEYPIRPCRSCIVRELRTIFYDSDSKSKHFSYTDNGMDTCPAPQMISLGVRPILSPKTLSLSRTLSQHFLLLLSGLQEASYPPHFHLSGQSPPRYRLLNVPEHFLVSNKTDSFLPSLMSISGPACLVPGSIRSASDFTNRRHPFGMPPALSLSCRITMQPVLQVHL